MRMMSRPDWLVSLVKSCEICGDVLFVIISSLTLPFTVGIKGGEDGVNIIMILRCKSVKEHASLPENISEGVSLQPEIKRLLEL